MKWKFEIEGNSATREVFPKLNSDFAIKWNKQDDRKYDFTKEIEDITFTGDDFNYLYTLEKNGECYFFYFRIYLVCGSEQENHLMYEGTFNTISVKWDLDRCVQTIKVKSIDPYTCIEDNDDEINVLDAGLQTYTINYSYSQDFDTIDNGMKLQNVLQYLLDQACPESNLTIVSDFFQWNAENITNINYVTGVFNKYRNLILFQKSDIKRPNASNNATKAETSFKKLLEDVLNIFNCGYKIIGNAFRIEHISWFETDLGLNLVQEKNLKLLRGTRKYGFNTTKIPKRETFSFMDARYIDFVGKDIVYNNNCTINSELNKIEIKVNNISTDIRHVIEQGYIEDTDVSDSGFVLVACSTQFNIYEEPGILTGLSFGRPNNILSWAHLHRDLWKYGRVFSVGAMNNNDTTEFFSSIPKIKQDNFDCFLNCSEIKYFDPLDKIKGMIGWGFVNTAQLKLAQCAIELDLLLENVQQVNTNNILGDFDENFDENFD